jgi:O-antigen ligase
MLSIPLPTLALFLAAFTLAPLAVLGANGLAALAATVGALALVRLWNRRHGLAVPWTVAAFPLLIALWAALSAAWAAEPGLALASAGRLALLAALGTALMAAAATLSAAERRAVTAGLLLGSLLAAALLGVESLTDNRLSGQLFEVRGRTPLPRGAKSQFNRGATILALTLWPLAGLLLSQGRRRTAAAAAAIIVAILLTGDSLAAKLALAAGAAIFAVALSSPRRAAQLLTAAAIAAAVALMAGAPHLPTPPASFVTLPDLPISAHHRLSIWQFTASRAIEKPLLGWGMEASRSVPGAEDRLDTQWIDAAGIDRGSLTGVRLPLHPHNAILQWWLELGLVGLSAAIALVWWVARRAARLDRQQPAALAALAAALVVANVSYGIWQSWWLCALWLCAALCATMTAGKDETP